MKSLADTTDDFLTATAQTTSLASNPQTPCIQEHIRRKSKYQQRPQRIDTPTASNTRVQRCHSQVKLVSAPPRFIHPKSSQCTKFIYASDSVLSGTSARSSRSGSQPRGKEHFNKKYLLGIFCIENAIIYLQAVDRDTRFGKNSQSHRRSSTLDKDIDCN